MFRKRIHATALPVVLVWAGLGCGTGLDAGSGDDDDDDGAFDAGASGQCFSSSECPTGWECSEFGVCVPPSTSGDGGVIPPEVEYELGQPASSQRFVYVAMTAQDALAKIDGATLAVTSVAVGESPEVVTTIPGTDSAVVLDTVVGTATVVRPAVGADDKDIVATLPNLNRLDVDPSGRFAVIWFDLNKAIEDAGGLGFVDQVGSFQDVTVVSLAPGQAEAVDLTVGFRPREVEFDRTGDHAYVVTEDGVSVVDLAVAAGGAPGFVPPIPVTTDAFGDPAGLEVNVVATGDYAVVRQPGVAALRVVRMTGADAGAGWDLALTAPPTDIDLSPDGARVYAAHRDPGALSIIDIPGDLAAPAGIETIDLAGATSGSLALSADGSRGLLFTNATLDERITLVALDQPGYPHLTWPLQKSVRAVGLAPSGGSALVLHAKAPGDPADAADFDDYIDRSHGYSLLDLASGFAKLQVTAVEPGPFAYAPSSAKIYVALDGGDDEAAVTAMQIVEVATGVVHTVDLGSPPSAVGILPSAGMAFVSQRHALGRMAFVDLASDAVRTVTGFDLNSQIID